MYCDCEFEAAVVEYIALLSCGFGDCILYGIFGWGPLFDVVRHVIGMNRKSISGMSCKFIIISIFVIVIRRFVFTIRFITYVLVFDLVSSSNLLCLRVC